MAVSIGSRLGPFEITGVLGKGGMGEVYRARDSRLQRDVAIKVSAERFSERFEREARVIAALNHPNICHVYDVGSAPEAPSFLVMELVEGPTLADRIKDGAIPLDEALALAHQIADALEAAHEKTVAHRDLKPGNIKITPDGKVKVLDFGLAKFGGSSPAVSDENSPTMHTASAAMTQAGVILGTAAYMAPEQARGRAVDTRADIWAFGVVLYEMLTGRRLFQGEDLTETLASVVKEQPNLDVVPKEVRRLLESCLRKDPKKRLQAIGDMRLLLEPSNATVENVAPAKTSRLWPAVAALALISTAILSFVHFRESPPEAAVTHLSVPLPDSVRGLGYAVISPNGRSVVAMFASDEWSGLWIRAFDGDRWVRLESARNGRNPFWSPDSRFVAFFADNKLKAVPASGGPARELCDGTGAGLGGSWGRSDVIVFGSRSGPLRKVAASGGECTAIMKDDPLKGGGHPEFLPDGQHFLYIGSAAGDTTSRGVYAASLADPIGEPLAGKKVLRCGDRPQIPQVGTDALLEAGDHAGPDRISLHVAHDSPSVLLVEDRGERTRLPKMSRLAVLLMNCGDGD